ncbi:MAG TPA: helical backbone metal receptor [Candidatus Binatia bacterium]|jgi:iron complex transport system substrate-binding protein|nr:helical backbone metal receptor [Candidatus Binatia bacterium]
MGFRPLLRLAALLVVATAASAATDCPTPATAPGRIVSITPAITETLFAIGAGPQVVGVSDYCTFPPETARLPHLGTTLTPTYETIARLDPELILSEDNVNVRATELRDLGPTCLIPWLTLDQFVAGIRTVGRVTGHAAPADALADRIRTRLTTPAPADAPRVLLVLASDTASLHEVWFIRRNSVHGAALAAAGGRNAVDEDVGGLPRLSLQRVLEIDPDVIVLLVAGTADEAAARERLLAEWRALEPLTAVRRNRIAVIDAPEAYITGPRILDLTDRLHAELARLAARP